MTSSKVENDNLFDIEDNWGDETDDWGDEATCYHGNNTDSVAMVTTVADAVSSGVIKKGTHDQQLLKFNAENSMASSHRNARSQLSTSGTDDAMLQLQDMCLDHVTPVNQTRLRGVSHPDDSDIECGSKCSVEDFVTEPQSEILRDLLCNHGRTENKAQSQTLERYVDIEHF